MQHALKSMTRARLIVLGVVAVLISLEQGLAGDPRPAEMSRSSEAEASLVEPLDPSALQVQPRVVVPSYYYGSGYQGYDYYPAAVQQVAPAPAAAPRPAASGRTSVGPGVRNWSTGRSSPLHRPWMKPM